MGLRAKVLLAGACAALPCTSAQAAIAAVRYTCSADKELLVQRDGAVARVSFEGRTYVLQRKPSSIGYKYLSAGAALIIDGPSAVFVTEGRLDLGACAERVPLASDDSSPKPRT